MDNELILFCVVRNDLQRLKKFLPYYRKLGVTSFVFTDNASDDGTYEYLQKQDDVILYREIIKYSARNRIKWINHMLSNHGIDKWCVVVDSDEFISYIDCESYNLIDMINVAKRNNYDGIAGFLLDMYSESEMFSYTTFDINNQQYFDSYGYNMNKESDSVFIIGGPRTRLFGIKNIISKYPIFHYTDKISYTNAHSLHINADCTFSPIWLAIRHYKFQTESDLQKLNNAVTRKLYYKKSRDYIPIYNYVHYKRIPTMYNCDISKKYINSHSLKCIEILNEPFRK